MSRSADSRSPVSEVRIRRDLAQLGIEPGDVLVVHSSLSAVGWVIGGATTVVRALIGVLGEQGTLAMPAATPYCGDPQSWSDPRISERRLHEGRDRLPLFDRDSTPTTMGAIAETFRTWPGTLRSDHPLESVCARGPAAAEITADHRLEFPEGPGTPFGRLNDLGCRVLLLGVGFNRCTALHLAETLSAKRRVSTVRFPALRDGALRWVEVPNVADDNDTHFPIIGNRFLSTRRPRQGSVGSAPAVLFSMPDLVRFAMDYFGRTF